MTKTKPNIDSGLSWIGTILKYMKEYGFWNIIKSCILLIFIILTLNICYNPSFLFKRFEEYSNRIHTSAKDVRMNNDGKIQQILPNLLSEIKSDRVWIIQYHNGTSDWNFGSMRFELCAENIEPIKWHYDNFHLSWLELPVYLKYNRFYADSVTNLKEVDCALHDILLKRGVKYIATIEINNRQESLGILGCTWERTPNMSDSEIRSKLSRYSGILEELLTPKVNYN